MSNKTKQPTLPEVIALATLLASAVKEHPDFDDGIPDSSKPLIELAEKALAALDSLQVGEPVTDHIEDVRGRSMADAAVGPCDCDPHIEYCPSCAPYLHEPLKPAGEEDKATYKQIADNYTSPANCPRCAEHERNIVEIIRDYDTKLDALEAELAIQTENVQSIADKAEGYRLQLVTKMPHGTVACHNCGAPMP